LATDLSASSSGSPDAPNGAASLVTGAAAEAQLAGAHRHIAELLLEQIEAADVLLLNKADTVGPEELVLLQVRLG
jgi:G3E family GTPase